LDTIVEEKQLSRFHIKIYLLIFFWWIADFVAPDDMW